MTPQILRQYLEVVFDFTIGIGGVVLAGYLLYSGQSAESIAGSLAAILASFQSVRKNVIAS